MSEDISRQPRKTQVLPYLPLPTGLPFFISPIKFGSFSFSSLSLGCAEGPVNPLGQSSLNQSHNISQVNVTEIITPSLFPGAQHNGDLYPPAQRLWLACDMTHGRCLEKPARFTSGASPAADTVTGHLSLSLEHMGIEERSDSLPSVSAQCFEVNSWK